LEGVFEIKLRLRAFFRFLLNQQGVENIVNMLVGQGNHVKRVLAEVEDGHEGLVLLPRNLEIGWEVLVQVPDIHIYTGEGALDLLLRVFVVPHVFIYI
jgi:hypothetical protein